MSLVAVLEKVGSNEEGLNAIEARARLEQHGPNRLPQEPPPTWWQIFLRQFQSPLIYILVAAAVVALLVGDFKDAGFIAVVLLLNAGIGGYQELRAEQSSRALQQLLRIQASVLRDGDVVEIDAEEVVPGDVVWLESGNRVPADLRLISAHGLEIDESLLTGESLGVRKDASWSGKDTVPVADRLNVAYAASIVVRGRAKGVVVATGTDTAIGQLAVAVQETSAGQAPLIKRMHDFARLVAIVVLFIASGIGLMGILVHGLDEFSSIVMFAIALAVAAIPEGLPAALTVALAIATTRMARRNAIVRRLAAVEGLGSCTLIASDKTGTLTCNELTVREVRLPNERRYEVTGEGFTPQGEVLLDGASVDAQSDTELADVVRAAVLCNEADLHHRNGGWAWRGDPTDVALLSLAKKLNITREGLLDDFPQLNEIPFEPEYQFAATYHRVEDGVQAFVKGGPERVLSMCDWSGREHDLEAMRKCAEQMAAQGFRVLGIADGAAPADLTSDASPPQPSNLVFRGFVGMIDPLRAGVREAVQDCHRAGIDVCMVTGDHPITALAISRELGLASDSSQVLSGSELADLNADQVRAAIDKIRVFARVTPRQKLELVQAARDRGHFVAVTGDGVNDAPALRAANIGVAMGKSGTDVAREAAELVISDDNFATIVAGVEEGRIAYDNVRKVVAQLTATGAAEVLLVSLALVAGALLALGVSQTDELSGVLLPLLPVQLLWLNLVTNGIQGVALAFEPGEGDALSRPPRPPSERIFNRLMIERTIVASSVMAIVSFAVFLWMLHAGAPIESSRNVLLLLMVLFENVHVGNNRSETKSAFSLSPLRSPVLLAGVVTAFLVHMAALYLPPLQAVLQTEPVGLTTWAMLITMALTVLAAMEIHKWSWRRRYGEQRSLDRR